MLSLGGLCLTLSEIYLIPTLGPFILAHGLYFLYQLSLIYNAYAYYLSEKEGS